MSKLINLENEYKAHRKRLLDKFLVEGNPNYGGAYLPASIRHLWGKDSEVIKWGDSTIMVSYFMMMVATEHYLKPKLTTLNELRNILKTLDRLDAVAENAFDKTISKKTLSGFFIRDDVKKDFLKKNTKLTKNGINLVMSDSSPYDFGNGADTSRNKEMSQDQFWHILLGFALVKKLVDDDICNKLIDNFITRVMKHIINKDWFIYNPVLNKKVARGCDVRVFSYGFFKAANKILDTNVNDKKKKHLLFRNIYFYLGIRKIQRTLHKLKLNEKSIPYLALSTIADIGIDNKQTYLKYFIDKHKRFEHFLLIYKILHNKGDVNKYKTYYEKLLKEVPVEHYNYSQSTGEFSSINWSSVNRLVDPEDSGKDNIHFNGEYNGIDFMLLYNLYKITYK
jgi:hypothetical protein